MIITMYCNKSSTYFVLLHCCYGQATKLSCLRHSSSFSWSSYGLVMNQSNAKCYSHLPNWDSNELQKMHERAFFNNSSFEHDALAHKIGYSLVYRHLQDMLLTVLSSRLCI